MTATVLPQRARNTTSAKAQSDTDNRYETESLGRAWDVFGRECDGVKC